MTQSETMPAETERIEVSVGFETHPEGAASMRVSADGFVYVETARPGQKDSFEGKVDAESARQLIAEANELGRAARAGKEKGLPDEARYSLRVTQANGRFQSLEAWESDLEASPSGRKLLGELRALATRVSDGRAIL